MMFPQGERYKKQEEESKSEWDSEHDRVRRGYLLRLPSLSFFDRCDQRGSSTSETDKVLEFHSYGDPIVCLTFLLLFSPSCYLLWFYVFVWKSRKVNPFSFDHVVCANNGLLDQKQKKRRDVSLS